MSAKPQFKKISNSQRRGRSSASSRSASNGSTPLFPIPTRVTRNAAHRNKSSNGNTSANGNNICNNRLLNVSRTSNGNRPSNRTPDISTMHFANETRDNSRNENGSNPASPMADFLAPNDNFEHGSPSSPVPMSTPESEASGTNALKHFRGPTRGLNLDKIIQRHGKIKIKFNPGETKPADTESSKIFSEAIGVAIRTCAEVEGVGLWRDVPDGNKDVCRRRLLQWFDIEDWDTERVQGIVYRALQNNYKNWRHALAELYRNAIDNDVDPRASCPREELQMNQWLSVCDWVECEYFQDRSLTNLTNRSCLKINHTSGRTCFYDRYRIMKKKYANKETTDEPSKIQLWKDNHVDGNGDFRSPEARIKYEKMLEYQQAPVPEGGTPMTEDQILVKVLGYRSGYQKGMGSGVEVSRKRKYASSSTHNDSEVNDKLLETQNELQNAKEKIELLTIEVEEQREKNKSSDDKIDSLQKEMAELKKIVLEMR